MEIARSNQSCCCWPTPQPQQLGIRATPAAYTTARGNARSFNHCVRTEIKPTYSWTPFGLITTEPQWELLFFRAAPEAYGSSQAWGQIGAAVASLCHCLRPVPQPQQCQILSLGVCNLHHRSQQHRILNPLSKARDQTYIFMDTSWFHYC